MRGYKQKMKELKNNQKGFITKLSGQDNTSPRWLGYVRIVWSEFLSDGD